jgi:hypothetical protein
MSGRNITKRDDINRREARRGGRRGAAGGEDERKGEL